MKKLKIKLKPRTWLIPSVIFTLPSSLCIWTKNLTYISQLTSHNITSCCKSYLRLCPFKTATGETYQELYLVFTHYTLYTLYLSIYLCIYVYIICYILCILYIMYIYFMYVIYYVYYIYIIKSTTRHLKFSYIQIFANLIYMYIIYIYMYVIYMCLYVYKEGSLVCCYNSSCKSQEMHTQN